MEWMGFDVGYYESESLHFSVVLNEVVCGTVVELVGFAKRLNANLLFSSREDAEELMRVRESLMGSGADLEMGDESHRRRVDSRGDSIDAGSRFLSQRICPVCPISSSATWNHFQ